MALRPQIPVAVASPDADLAVIRQCGIGDVSLMLNPKELRDDVVARAQERLARFDLTVSDAFCMPLQKNRAIHLGLPERDEAGYIKAGEDCMTSIPGIFAAGDVRTKALRQVITACADGANAVTSISAYFNG